MSGTCMIDVCGEALALLPERALLWLARRTLLIADAHFGKSAAFRAAGMPLPRGATSDDLQRMTALVERHAVDRIVFLGDFLHSRHSRNDATLAALIAWRERHPALALELVRGNHDRHAGPPPAGLGVTEREEPWVDGPFAFAHHPEGSDAGYVLAGHVHPAVRLFGTARERVRLPCFVFGERIGVLPAFGALTGTQDVERAPRQRLYAVTPQRVFAVPASG
jgi:DNA ligase-associated metallophosphoesterase